MQWEPEAVARLKRAVAELNLSARGWERARRVAVTVADLAESEVVTSEPCRRGAAIPGRRVSAGRHDLPTTTGSGWPSPG